jgi:hypothetical protein
MRVEASDEGHVNHAGKRNVAHVTATTGDQARILPPAHAGADGVTARAGRLHQLAALMGSSARDRVSGGVVR